MRFKVGDVWHEQKPGRPIMVELSDRDKELIASMVSDNHRYAEFAEADPTYNDHTKRQEWMLAGR